MLPKVTLKPHPNTILWQQRNFTCSWSTVGLSHGIQLLKHQKATHVGAKPEPHQGQGAACIVLPGACAIPGEAMAGGHSHLQESTHHCVGYATCNNHTVLSLKVFH